MANLQFNNISTIINSILLTVFGLLLGYATSQGLDLPVSADTLASLFGGIILFIFSYYNAKHHNTYFDKDNDKITIPIDNLDDEQVAFLNEAIEKAVNKIGEENA